MIKLSNIRLIEIGWYDYNGLIIEFLGIDINSFDSALFGINISTKFLYINILFIKFRIY